ncbi:MAG TPA: DUF5615 family PIN-like protein [Lichenihabitans sp.]|nr:DUF5615 family PIN-like protein [Lichenihabitans sp.]
MKLVVDMNLSPDWITALRGFGHDAIHWRSVGPANAPDDEILQWARAEGRTVLTSDLDFGSLLATSGASKPSVVQLRTGTTLPSRIGSLIARVLRETEADLLSGALVTVAEDRVRLRPLVFTARL